MSNIETKDLEAYKDKGNLLLPTTSITQATPWHKLTITEVKISSNPEDGEVFPQQDKPTRQQIKGEWKTVFVPQFSLGKVALMKIAQAAGITWDYTQCGPIGNVSRDYVLYKAVGMVRLPAGNYQVIPATKEIDLSVIEDELMEQNLKKAATLANSEKPAEKAKLQGMTEKEWAERQTKSALIQWRKHKIARAETGAMERVIRAALSMKQTYTVAELAKPFIVPRIDFSPDYTDPVVQQMMLTNGLRAMNSLFAETAAINSFPQPNIITVAPEEEEIITIDGEEPEYIPDLDDGPIEVPTEEPVKEPEKSTDAEPNDSCEDCGTSGLSDRIREFSIRVYDKQLCMACQKNHQKKR